MFKELPRLVIGAALTLLCATLLAPSATAQDEITPFSSEGWIMRNAEVVTHMDRE